MSWRNDGADIFTPRYGTCTCCLQNVLLQRSAALREVDGWRMTVAPISRRDWHNIYRHYMHSCDWAQTYYRCHRVRIFTSQLNWYSYTIYEFFRKFISSYRNGSDIPINSINLIKFNCIYVCMYVCMYVVFPSYEIAASKEASHQVIYSTAAPGTC